MGGAVVQDFGHIADGDKISCTATVFSDGWETIKSYWDRRTLVDVIDEAGNVLPNMRVVVKSYEHISRFPNAYKLSLEFWRV